MHTPGKTCPYCQCTRHFFSVPNLFPLIILFRSTTSDDSFITPMSFILELGCIGFGALGLCHWQAYYTNRSSLFNFSWMIRQWLWVVLHTQGIYCNIVSAQKQLTVHWDCNYASAGATVSLFCNEIFRLSIFLSLFQLLSLPKIIITNEMSITFPTPPPAASLWTN